MNEWMPQSNAGMERFSPQLQLLGILQGDPRFRKRPFMIVLMLYILLTKCKTSLSLQNNWLAQVAMFGHAQLNTIHWMKYCPKFELRHHWEAEWELVPRSHVHTLIGYNRASNWRWATSPIHESTLTSTWWVYMLWCYTHIDSAAHSMTYGRDRMFLGPRKIQYDTPSDKSSEPGDVFLSPCCTVRVKLPFRFLNTFVHTYLNITRIAKMKVWSRLKNHQIKKELKSHYT